MRAHYVHLFTQQAGERQPAARPHPRHDMGRQLHQRAGQYVGHHDIGVGIRRQGGGQERLKAIAHTVQYGIAPADFERLLVDVHAQRRAPRA